MKKSLSALSMLAALALAVPFVGAQTPPRDVEVPVTVRLVPLASEHAEMAPFGINADMLRVQSEFRVNLSDYGVSVMAPLRLEVSNEIRVRVDLTAFRQA